MPDLVQVLYARRYHRKKPESDAIVALKDAVCEAEGVADISLRAMIDSLSKGSYLPSTKQELINIATSCDKIANKCETVAKRIVLYRISFPEEVLSEFSEISDVIEKQFVLLQKSIEMLFSKFNHLQKDASILDEIRDLETKVDTIEARLADTIFNRKAELAEKMLFISLIEELCNISDIIEDIADKIQIMLITRRA